MGTFMLKNKSGDASISPMHHSGVPGVSLNWPCELILKDDSEMLEIRPKMSKKESIFLPLERIVAIAEVAEKEIVEKSKSVLGRAFVGGILLGPVGAIVGGTSGVGKKEKAKYSILLVINYKSKSSDEVEAVVFDTRGLLNVKKFIELVKGRSINIAQPQLQSNEPIIL